MANKYVIRSIDKITGEVVGVYKSVAEAARIMNTKNIDKLRFAINSGWKSAFGFRWEKIRIEDLPKKQVTEFCKKKIPMHEAVKFLAAHQNSMSYKEISKKTGYSVDELRWMYDDNQLYGKGVVNG